MYSATQHITQNSYVVFIGTAKMFENTSFPGIRSACWVFSFPPITAEVVCLVQVVLPAEHRTTGVAANQKQRATGPAASPDNQGSCGRGGRRTENRERGGRMGGTGGKRGQRGASRGGKGGGREGRGQSGGRGERNQGGGGEGRSQGGGGGGRSQGGGEDGSKRSESQDRREDLTVCNLEQHKPSLSADQPQPSLPANLLQQSPRFTPPQVRTKVLGKRRVWGTLKAVPSGVVKSSICNLTSLPSESFNIKRKFKRVQGNKVRWWHVLTGSEDDLITLEKSWDLVQIQTGWKVEACFMSNQGFQNSGPNPIT